MEIQSLTLGTWFPRTTLHLDEVASALRDSPTSSRLRAGLRGAGPVPGTPKEALKLARGLGIRRVGIEEGAFRVLRATAGGTPAGAGAKAGDVSLSLTEDGILLLSATGGNLATARGRLTRFYEERFGPFTEALFRRGMPLPKELANVQSVLPFFATVTGGTLAEARALAQGSRKSEVGGRSAAATLAQLTLLPGRATTVLHLPDAAAERSLPLPLEEVMRYFTFFREFEAQAHTYLRLHRELWESVDAIREARRLRYRDLTVLRDRVGTQRKTIGFVRARIAQMGDILSARSQYVHDEHLDVALEALRAFRFDSLSGAQSYLAHLWEVTDRYAEQTEALLGTIRAENLHREVAVLNIIIFGALLTGFFGMNVPFPWDAAWTDQWPTTAALALVLLLIGVGGSVLFRAGLLNRTFTIREIERGKR